MTLTSFFGIFLTGRVSVTEKLLMKDLLSEESLSHVKSLLYRITVFTVVIEGMGAVLLYLALPSQLGLTIPEAVFYSLFHSVSAFCNAGFSLFPEGFTTPAISEAKFFLSTAMVLIILGGLGFPVLSQLYERGIFFINRNIGFFRKASQTPSPPHTNPPTKLSVSTKLVLFVTGFLLVVGALATYLLEAQFSLIALDSTDQLFHSLFLSVTMRTAGFSTVEIHKLSMTMLLLSFVWMWIGASPVGTGGGIKTSTVAVALLQIWALVRGKDHVEAFGRTIAPASIGRAFAAITLSLFVIFSGIFSLSITENFPMEDIAFETISAYSTVGLSRGITSTLSPTGKLILAIVMFLGRVGVFNAVLAIVQKPISARYSYPTEYVVIS